MFEVELKAHVADRASVIAALNGFACYEGAVQKEDAYYAKAGGKRARLRKETPFIADGAPPLASGSEPPCPRVFFTYKRKEVRTDSAGNAVEVNDEKECMLSDASPLEAYLCDNGFSIVLQKQKTVLGWKSAAVHIELCTVPPLGDFLELEVLSERNDAATVEALRADLCAVLAKAGIDESQIENRYYSEMLRAAFEKDAQGGFSRV